MEFPSIGSTDKTVCLEHIEDGHLRARLGPNAADHECSFCPLRVGPGTKPIAVNLEYLAEAVADVAGRFFEDAANAPSFDGEVHVEDVDTLTVVYEMLDEAVLPDVLDDLAHSVSELIREPSFWIRSDNESYVEFEWSEFSNTVKHTSRLVLQPRPGLDRALTPPERLYAFLEALSKFASDEVGLVQILNIGSSVYRARIDRDPWALEKDIRTDPARKLGPAPNGLAPAGRMNAQGISLFYAAFEPETSCAEVVAHSPYDVAVVGEFVLQRQLRILDLTQVPTRPSIFDEGESASYPFMAFFDYFRDAITRPVILDGKHPIDYAPTQVVTEFLRWGTDTKLDGIAWESSLVADGKNVVLFFGPETTISSPTEATPERSRIWERTFEEEDPVFRIDPSSIQRYRAERFVLVQKSRW